MNCELCLETNVGLEHEISEKHRKNKVLYEYALHRKQFGGNRKGVVVSCSVRSTFFRIENCVDSKIKISAKPNEEIKFNFSIKNESKKEELIIVFIQKAHNKLNFVLNDNSLGIGCDRVILKPKEKFQREVSVLFKSSNIGQFELPIIFLFRKPVTNEDILIMRDMVVYVEERQTIHEKMISPYAQKEVMAEKLYKTTIRNRNDDMFPIPKNNKRIYANGLRIREDSEVEKKLCEAIREIFTTGITEDNYAAYFHNLLWYEETIVRINLKKYNMSNVRLLPQNGSYALVVPGLAEKRPSLMLGDRIFVRPHDNEEIMFEAVISEISAENIVNIKGLHSTFDDYFSYTATFDVRFFMSRLPLERMHYAVHSAATPGPDQCRIFPVPNKKLPKIKPIKNYFNPVVESNPEQARAVQQLVAGSAGAAPYLLHGPPGTGKTVTVVEAILQLVHNDPKNRIMVCTDSNMAADHVATMLIKYAHMFHEDKFLLRASSKFRVWETLPKCLREYSNGWNRSNFMPVSAKTLMSYSIVVTTLSHAAKFAKEVRQKRLERCISHLFIDEAAQASEPACLIPGAGLLAPHSRLVLAGDPLQLGPVVISHNARRLGLGLSLMERLKKTCELYSDERSDPNYTLMLRNNFRSDPAILLIPNEKFYQGQLRVHAKHDPISKVDILGQREKSQAIVFHGVLSKEQRMGKSPSFFNNMELEIVQMYIMCLIDDHKVLPEDIGVVTPYIRQVYKIKSWISEQSFGPGVIEVGTVEAFQGKEKRVIIISTVRANCSLLDHDAKFQLGFLVDDKRFNVALTRAKAKVVVIGNPLCLEKDEKWRAYMDKCREFGTYFGYDPQQENTEEANKDIVDRITPLLKDLKVNKTKV